MRIYCLSKANVNLLDEASIWLEKVNLLEGLDNCVIE